MRLTTQQVMEGLFLIGSWNFNIRPLDAMGLAIEFKTHYDERIDWHEFSYLLDRLKSFGFLDLVGHSRDRMCQYRIKGYQQGVKK
jgi:hypothetical protein